MSGVGGIFKGRWAIWIIALVFALVTAFGVLSVLGRWADQKTYFVLNKAIPVDYQITQDVLTEVTVNADGVPPTALTADDVAAGDLYSRLALASGEVLTASVAGPREDFLAELPPGYVLSSISVPPENAVGGRVAAGNYIDIAAVQSVGSTEIAKIILHRVLVLNVAVAPESIADAAATGPNSQANYDGFPQIYILALSPKDFLTLSLVNGGRIFIALTSESATGPLDALVDGSTIFTPGGVPASSPILFAGTNVAVPTAAQVSAAVGTTMTAGPVTNIPGADDATGYVYATYLAATDDSSTKLPKEKSLIGDVSAGLMTTVADIEVLKEGYRNLLGADAVIDRDGVTYVRQGAEGSPTWMALIPAGDYVAAGTCTFLQEVAPVNKPADVESVQSCAAKMANLMVQAISSGAAAPAPGDEASPTASPSPSATAAPDPNASPASPTAAPAPTSPAPSGS